MNKAELIRAIATKADITQTGAAKVLNALIETVQETLEKGESVRQLQNGTLLTCVGGTVLHCR